MRSRSILLVLLLALPLFAACEVAGSKDHVLDRTGYGSDAWSRARISALGTKAYIEEQLQPQTLDDSALEAEIASRYPLTTWTYKKVRTTYHEYNTTATLLPGRVRSEMSWARMLRNVRSKRQLEQVLVDFWYNHFNVDSRSETARWGVVTYEREAIRPFVLGKFRDMLGAVAAHPAMLDYLDNGNNFVPGYMRGTTRFGPNENYGRELLELHTVGAEAGYTLQDIQEVARAFTGWTINYYLPNGYFNYFEDSFVYEDAGHDKGAKSIMGSLYIPAGGGKSDGDAVLDFLARHPSTAHHIAFKLAQRFVADDPPPTLVGRAAATFLETDGDLREVTRTILLSAEFQSVDYRAQKIKRPQHFAASLARAVGVADSATFANYSAGEVGKMGELLYAAAPPTGYPETSTYWLGEGSFIAKINLAMNAAYGRFGYGPAVSSPLSADPASLVPDLASRLAVHSLGALTKNRLIDFSGRIPEWERAPETAAALLASPVFQRH